MTILEIMQKAVSMNASDVFLVAGLPVTFKCDGHQERLPDNIMKPPEIQEIVENIYEMAHRNRGNLDRGIDDDFSFAVWNLGRFRVNVFRQRGSLAAVIRVIRFGLPDPADYGLSDWERDSDGVWHTVLTQGDWKLSIGFRTDREKGTDIVEWKHSKSWTEDESIGQLWDGGF